ncbi:MAG: choice-of-anchor D domain-containing protein, partial [Bacteroidota bacterium]
MKPIFNPISIGSMLKTILVFCCPLLFSISLVAQSLELEPDSVCITLLSGEETTSQLQINNPDGSDYDFEVVLPELPFDTSVTSFYDFPGDASFFSIPISQLSIEPFEDSLEVSIIVNGDYDSNGEVADILINGMYWGQIGGNGPNGEDQVVEITISGNNLADIVQIGSVDLEIYNFFDVGVGEGGEDRHTVVVRKAGLSWLEISPLEGTVSANQSTALQLSFNTNELPAGTYEVNLPISFDPPNPATLFAKVQLEVTGRTLAVFPEVPFDFGEVLFGDSRQRDFVIENQGSEAYVITDFSVDAPQYSLNVPFTIIDPFSTYSLPISFTPDALGSFPANLTISSTIGDTIIPIIGLGVDPPAISLQPDSICVQLLSGDTETAQLYIDNPGASTLQYEIELIPDPNDFNFAFYEDFEDQDYQPFTLTNPQIFDVSYVTDNTAQGNYSMKLSSQQFGFLEGLQADVNDANIDYFGFSVRSDDASANAEDFSLLLRDFTNGIHDMFFFQRFPGNLLFVSSGVENLQITYTPGEWIHVELKNIDFAQHTYDLYINEDLKKAGIVFDPNVTRFGQINIFNIVGGDTYWDEITAGTGDLVFDWISLSQN